MPAVMLGGLWSRNRGGDSERLHDTSEERLRRRARVYGRIDVGERAVANYREVDQSVCHVPASAWTPSTSPVGSSAVRGTPLSSPHDVAARCLESNQYRAYHATLLFTVADRRILPVGTV